MNGWVIGETWWFQFLERGWRPVQQWGFAIAAVGYAFRPLFDRSFQIETFAALAAVSMGGFFGRGIEKVGRSAVGRPLPDGTPADPVYVDDVQEVAK